MGLIRIAVVSAAAIALLPSDRESQDKLYERAATATHWAVTFCDRNVETCEQGSELWTKFIAKAEFGARMALDIARDQSLETIASASNDNGEPPQQSTAPMSPAVLERRGGTLTPEDLKPAWRGKSAPKGSI